MASGELQNAGTGSYVAPPASAQTQPPVDEQLNQLKLTAEGKINEFVGNSKEQFDKSKNAPENREAADKLAQDTAATTQDAKQSYNTGLQQLGKVFHTAQESGQQVAQQTAAKRDQAAATELDLIGAARQQAQQRSQDAQLHAQGGQSALQQGFNTLKDAVTQGVSATNQKLQEGSHAADTTGKNAPASESKGVQAGDQQSPSIFQSATALFSQTALSVKEAVVGKSPTTNANTATPTTTNSPVTHPPAQTMTESIGQTATAVKDAVMQTWSSNAPAGNNVRKDLPSDVPPKASE